MRVYSHAFYVLIIYIILGCVLGAGSKPLPLFQTELPPPKPPNLLDRNFQQACLFFPNHLLLPNGLTCLVPTDNKHHFGGILHRLIVFWFQSLLLHQRHPWLRPKQNQYGQVQGVISTVNRLNKLTVRHSHQAIHLRDKIYVAHRPPKDWADWTALKMVRLLRRGTDFATGYKHHVASPKMAGDLAPQMNTVPYAMTEQKWLTRFVFLESVAGVPGMVAGMLRHLHSLRRLKKDNGW